VRVMGSVASAPAAAPGSGAGPAVALGLVLMPCAALNSAWQLPCSAVPVFRHPSGIPLRSGAAAAAGSWASAPCGAYTQRAAAMSARMVAAADDDDDGGRSAMVCVCGRG